jgi:hypothetical protein
MLSPSSASVPAKEIKGIPIPDLMCTSFSALLAFRASSRASFLFTTEQFNMYTCSVPELNGNIPVVYTNSFHLEINTWNT